MPIAYDYKINKREKICFFILGVIILSMAALRNGIGNDWNNYKYIYDIIQLNKDNFFKVINIEIGYAFLNIIFPNYNMLIIIVALFSVTTKFYFIEKYSYAKFISLLIYFSTVFVDYDMGVIRQGISISMFLISLQFIQKQKFFNFILVIFIGSLFHITTIFFIPLYFINYTKISRNKIYILTLLAFLLSFVDLTQIIMFISNLLSLDVITYRIAVYTNVSSSPSLVLFLIKRIFVLIIFTEFYKKYKIKDKMSLIFFNGYFLSVILSALLSSVPIMAGRGTMGLYFLQVFVFARIIASSKKSYIKIGLFVLVIILSIDTMSSVIIFGNMSNQPYTPYKSIIKFALN